MSLSVFSQNVNNIQMCLKEIKFVTVREGIAKARQRRPVPMTQETVDGRF